MRYGLSSVFTCAALGATMASLGCWANPAQAQQDVASATRATAEPVFRVSKLVTEEKTVPKETPVKPVVGERVAEAPKAVTNAAPHPLDRALSFANDSLTTMRDNVEDYTAILCKRERYNGVVGDVSYMSIKVRCPRVDAQGNRTPFSLYMKFLKPRDSAGREVIWVDGQNDGNIVAHEGKGLLALKRFYLPPTGAIAMTGQRYPIYEAGLENLIIKLIEKAERDRAAGPCTVNYRENLKINKRPCSLIELIHEVPKAPYEFHKAQVFIDDELNLPVRYAAYDWPQHPDAEPCLIEEYTYFNIKTNVGLTDADFDPSNPDYKFPGR